MTEHRPDAAGSPASAPASECRCHSPSGMTRIAKWATVAGLLSSVGVCAACCLLPVLLVGMGVTGAWIGGLDAFAPYKRLLVIMTVAFLGYGFFVAYRRAGRGVGPAPGSEVSDSQQAVRRWLWIATALAISGLIFERVARLLQ